jgi:putative transcriptional regulator
VEEGAHVRGFLGYSGWSGGQLEGELRAQSWVVALLAEDLLALPHDASLWRTLLGREGDEWRLLAGEPEDPERN